MTVLRGPAILIAILIVTACLLLPFALQSPLSDGEVWIFQSIREMQVSSGLIPTLNERPFAGQNPLQVLLFSLVPSGELITLRLVLVVLGCLFTAAVCLFALRVYGGRTALFSSLITMTSLGFIMTHSGLQPQVLPGTLCVLAVLIFSLAYLGKAKPWWYVVAHILAGMASITGGWIMLGCYLGFIVLLILLDLAPVRFLNIHPIPGILILAGTVGSFLLLYRLAGGSHFLSEIFSFGQETGFLSRTALLFIALLPWLPLLVPAWIYLEKDIDTKTWHDLLPIKTAFFVSVVAVLFSSRFDPVRALLILPFAGLLVGFWLANGLRQQKPGKIMPISLAVSGSFLFLGTLAAGFFSRISAGSLHAVDGALAVVVLSLGIVFFFLLRSKRHLEALILGCVTVFILYWSLPILEDPLRDVAKQSYLQEISLKAPLLVYSDDLVMRGYLGSAGVRPFIISRETLPIGGSTYLAVSTENLENLLDTLGTFSDAILVSSLRGERTYALIRLDPLSSL